MSEIRCPNCGTSFKFSDGTGIVTQLREGIHYLLPDTVRNENRGSSPCVTSRLEALKTAGVNIDALQGLMQANNSIIANLFKEDDPIIEELSKGGFIRNPELFRRWICAQTFRLLRDPAGWTAAVRKHYDIKYVFKQCVRELVLLVKLYNKCPNDIRFSFFTLYDLKRIFSDLADYANEGYFRNTTREYLKNKIMSASSFANLLDVIRSCRFKFSSNATKHLPREWLNCFKGAGAYYTLQNIIRTHGLILPNCNNMEESLAEVENWFKEITDYEPCQRRWDIMLSILTNAIKQKNFELQY